MHAELIEKALTRYEGGGGVAWSSASPSAPARVLALAAAWCSSTRGATAQPRETIHVVAAVAVSRSTQELFPERFAPTGGESARIDRIAMARAADLRDNEFAKWGVR